MSIYPICSLCDAAMANKRRTEDLSAIWVVVRSGS